MRRPVESRQTPAGQNRLSSKPDALSTQGPHYLPHLLPGSWFRHRIASCNSANCTISTGYAYADFELGLPQQVYRVIKEADALMLCTFVLRDPPRARAPPSSPPDFDS